MKIPNFANVRLYPTSADTETRDRQLHWWIHYMIRRRLVRKLICAHRKKTGLTGTMFLQGHGRRHAPKWLYFDYGKEKLVQSWIDEYDGVYSLLIIGVCNCQNYSVHAKRSIVVHPNQSIGLMTMMKLRGGYSRVYVPGFGYVEHEAQYLKKVIRNLST